MPEFERINRYLSRRGVASRRGADALIAGGRVQVNGNVAGLGEQVSADDRVTVDGKPVGDPLPVATTIMLNKPTGFITAVVDARGEPTVMELVPKIPALVPVGRLDKETKGLLLFTTDGDLAFRMTHPRFGLARRYEVTLSAALDPKQKSELTTGIKLEDGFAKVSSLKEVVPKLVEVEMLEGRKREVRRLFAAVGSEVVELRRLAFGPLQLGKLREGGWKDLTQGELTAIYGAVGLPMPSPKRPSSRHDLPTAVAKRDPSRREAPKTTDNS